MQQYFNELYDYKLTGEVRIEGGDEEEIPTMVIDEDQDSIDEETEEKNGRYFQTTSFIQNQ